MVARPLHRPKPELHCLNQLARIEPCKVNRCRRGDAKQASWGPVVRHWGGLIDPGWRQHELETSARKAIRLVVE
eukprot:8915499-Alexandrium_andersonii.AAC.1